MWQCYTALHLSMSLYDVLLEPFDEILFELLSVPLLLPSKGPGGDRQSDWTVQTDVYGRSCKTALYRCCHP